MAMSFAQCNQESSKAIAYTDPTAKGSKAIQVKHIQWPKQS
ncbi:hypothetical protein CCACVL1_25688 [Corchorus capsularis]|uniref:Uncharacterized protein n=1 Tax=Corchorus capsularis TaxID=210143 RepID=A0A1R3GI75_COCAP|nr:hypothetical protein CCACVL1_25688 [Corchorus capsularis]